MEDARKRNKVVVQYICSQMDEESVVKATAALQKREVRKAPVWLPLTRMALRIHDHLLCFRHSVTIPIIPEAERRISRITESLH